MKTIYKPNLKAHVSVDDANKVRQIRHSQEYWESEDNIPSISAETYLNEWAETLQIPNEHLQNLTKNVSFYDPREQGVEYHLDEEKHMFDSTTIGYYQTYLNTPVWRKGISITIKQNPNRIVASTNNSEYDLKGSLPDKKAIENYKSIFQQIVAHKTTIDPALGEVEDKGEAESEAAIRKSLNINAPSAKARRGSAVRSDDRIRLLSGKFFVYKYDPRKRFAGKPELSDSGNVGEAGEEREIPLLPLPTVNDKIKAGRAYLVAEIIFKYDPPGFSGLVWLILVEVETGSILYIECMTCGVNGLVFKRDPINKTGDLTITSDDSNAILNPHRDDVTLTNLNAPIGGVQSLTGTYVTISEEESPVIAAPTEPVGTDFDYDVRTNNFGAVNAYYHQTQLIKTIEDLGFPRSTYFDGTTFPIPVDHRGLGDVINAHWAPNGTGGTDHMCYALCDTTDTVNPVCRSVDPYVHWHEMGGHGTLGDHVNSGLLGFAHSAGDGLAAIQMDPKSALRNVPERFRYAPFRPFTTERRFDRPVSTWAWNGGANDDGGYGSEQILATCHFRIYRSLGGDSNDLNRRKFAARVTSYLILRTIGSLTPATNPNSAEVWCELMQDIDQLNWISEGLDGGAYNKVIRWAFEKQGNYQSPGTPTPVTTPGAPPAVDVYIDDGRGGEYQYQAVHWQNQSMWNRNTNDGLTGHQNGIDGQTNYMYAKVKNRGTTVANNITVRAYHTKPGAGLTWPYDFVEMNPVGGLPIASIPANSASEVQVGPFEWEPNINAYGHDCVLMIASAAGDPSNIDNFTGTESIQEWRLVPHDNNIGQRNVSVVPGAGGGEALVAALDGAFFLAGNNLNRRAVMELRVEMPALLTEKGWQLVFGGISDNKFLLKAGEKRRIQLTLKKGTEFTKADIEGSSDRQINVSLLANGILLGGMSYYVDPNLKKPSGGKQPSGKECDDAAQQLLDCLKISGGKKVKKVCVKKVSVDIELDSDCGCD
jgi:zinc metalloprotease ZmpB